MENLCEDPVFQEMFAEIGIDSKNLKEDKETQQAIYDFIEKAGLSHYVLLPHLINVAL